MFDELKKKAAVTGAKVGTKIIKHSPQILFGLGCITFVGTIVLSHKQAVKIDAVLTDHSFKRAELEEKKNDDITYDKSNYNADVVDIYRNTIFRVVRLSAPVVAMGLASIACFGGAQYIVCARFAALTTEYIALDNGFKEYRKNVIAEEGEDKDFHYLYSTYDTVDKIPVLDEEGNLEEKEVPRVAAGNQNISVLISKETVKNGWFSGIENIDEAIMESFIRGLTIDYEKKMCLTRADVYRKFGLYDLLKDKKDTAWMFGKIYKGEDDLNIKINRAYLPDYEKSTGNRTVYYLTWDEENLYDKL